MVLYPHHMTVSARGSQQTSRAGTPVRVMRILGKIRKDPHRHCEEAPADQTISPGLPVRMITGENSTVARGSLLARMSGVPQAEALPRIVPTR